MHFLSCYSPRNFNLTFLCQSFINSINIYRTATMCWEQELQKQEALWLFTFQSGEQANNQQTTGGALFREHRIPVGWTQRSGLSPSLGQEGKVCKGFLERSLSLKEGCIGMKPSCVCPRDDLSDRDENLKRQRGERQPGLMGTPAVQYLGLCTSENSILSELFGMQLASFS